MRKAECESALFSSNRCAKNVKQSRLLLNVGTFFSYVFLLPGEVVKRSEKADRTRQKTIRVRKLFPSTLPGEMDSLKMGVRASRYEGYPALRQQGEDSYE